MTAIRITQDEWIAELTRLQRKSDPGKTTTEIAELWKVSERVAGQRLNMLNRQGRLQLGFRSVVRRDGRPCSVPVYKIKGVK